jgi:predicted membrane-bound spermidine synthase
MRSGAGRTAFLASVFFVSGVSAIVYQIVWQRALFTLFGSSMDAVTLVVTAFLLGLGAGSALGGGVSTSRFRLPLVFGIVELLIGLFGVVSLPLFRAVAAGTTGASVLGVGFIAGLLVLVATVCMGATLPVLVAWEVRRSGAVGKSVGLLYAVNTLGSAAGAAVGALFLLGALGMERSVWAAAAGNAVVALSVFAVAGREEAPA